MSQKDTYKAGIRFELANGAALAGSSYRSEVVDCSLRDGETWGIVAKHSKNIRFQGNNIYNFVQQGVIFDGSSNMAFSDNIVNLVHPLIKERNAGINTCWNGGCTGLVTSGNILAGAS